MKYREITSEDMSVIYDVRIKTWHNANGRAELERMGITHTSVSEMLTKSHRGWLCEINNQVVAFAIGNKETAEM